MRRRAQLVILCEDNQHEAFARRMLEKLGWETRKMRVEKCPPGSQSGAQWVRERYPVEVKALRATSVTRALVVMMDADAHEVAEQRRFLADQLAKDGVAPRGDDEPIALVLPRWHVETWLAYLGGATVDEAVKYPYLERESACAPHVDRLAAMCRDGALRAPAPASLEAACLEIRKRLPS